MKPVLEQIPAARQQSIYAFHFEKQHFETPWHFHPQHELTYIEESTGTRFIGDHVSAYEPGELVLSAVEPAALLEKPGKKKRVISINRCAMEQRHLCRSTRIGRYF